MTRSSKFSIASLSLSPSPSRHQQISHLLHFYFNNISLNPSNASQPPRNDRDCHLFPSSRRGRRPRESRQSHVRISTHANHLIPFPQHYKLSVHGNHFSLFHSRLCFPNLSTTISLSDRGSNAQQLSDPVFPFATVSTHLFKPYGL